MQIRKASFSDMSTLIENNIKLAKESEGISLEKSTVESAVMHLLKDPTKGFYLVAEEQNEVIGQLMITFEWSDWRDATIWWIQSVYINEENRKQGIFKKLLNTLQKLARAEHVNFFRLYVHESNISAIAVYKHLRMKEKTYKIFETDLENLSR